MFIGILSVYWYIGWVGRWLGGWLGGWGGGWVVGKLVFTRQLRGQAYVAFSRVRTYEVSQCLSGYWSKVLGLVWIDILTNNFR